MILLLASFLLPVTVQAAERTIIILIRHGETEYNKEDRFQGTMDIPLDETGLRQADMLAESLKDVP
ncbi:MAG: histidine phosphatase family protein, partial [Selenomonadaceae bacterium]|nr:histidine phosphatase family protein [Selenomonadaceae bacterium]